MQDNTTGSGTIPRCIQCGKPEHGTIACECVRSVDHTYPLRPLMVEADIAKGKGTKDDTNKVDVTLVDPEFVEGMAKVMMMGAKKYKRGNWQLSLEPIRILGALIRHAYKILRGEWNDQESGLPHAFHIGCNAMFLAFYQRRGDSIGTEHDKG